MGEALITRRGGGGGELTEIARFICTGSPQTIQLDSNKDYVVTATYGTTNTNMGFGVWLVKKGVLTQVNLLKESFPDVYIIPTLSSDCVLTTGRGYSSTFNSDPTITFIFGIA